MPYEEDTYELVPEDRVQICERCGKETTEGIEIIEGGVICPECDEELP